MKNKKYGIAASSCALVYSGFFSSNVLTLEPLLIRAIGNIFKALVK